MSDKKKLVFNIFKWLILIVVFAYLYYTLAQVEVWDELKEHFVSTNRNNYISLLIVILLMPLNIGIEALKWNKLVNKINKTSFSIAVKAMLSGMATGFVSPNRVGDFAGRILFLPKDKRAKGVMLSLLNSITQNFILILFGIIATYFFYTQYQHEAVAFSYFIKIFLIILLVTVVLLLLFLLTKRNFNNKYIEKAKELIQLIFSFTILELSIILSLTALRYAVFCIQFYFMLAFFGIDLSTIDALIAIPTTYLIITFTPSYALAEPAVRGTVSLLVLAHFTSNEVGAVLTSVATWLINYIFPMAIGSIVLLKRKK